MLSKQPDMTRQKHRTHSIIFTSVQDYVITLYDQYLKDDVIAQAIVASMAVLLYQKVFKGLRGSRSEKYYDPYRCRPCHHDDGVVCNLCWVLVPCLLVYICMKKNTDKKPRRKVYVAKCRPLRCAPDSSPSESENDTCDSDAVRTELGQLNTVVRRLEEIVSTSN